MANFKLMAIVAIAALAIGSLAEARSLGKVRAVEKAKAKAMMEGLKQVRKSEAAASVATGKMALKEIDRASVLNLGFEAVEKAAARTRGAANPQKGRLEGLWGKKMREKLTLLEANTAKAEAALVVFKRLEAIVLNKPAFALEATILLERLVDLYLLEASVHFAKYPEKFQSLDSVISGENLFKVMEDYFKAGTVEVAQVWGEFIKGASELYALRSLDVLRDPSKAAPDMLTLFQTASYNYVANSRVKSNANAWVRTRTDQLVEGGMTRRAARDVAKREVRNEIADMKTEAEKFARDIVEELRKNKCFGV